MDKNTDLRPTIYHSKPDLNKDIRLIDGYSSAIEELFYIDNPELKKGVVNIDPKLREYEKNYKLNPVWIYYPWKNICVMTVPEKEYFKLRTARNKNILSDEEQTNYRNTKVGIIGLSIGSSILSALVYTGGPKDIRMADFDKVEITNLNRMQANLTEIGENKTVVAARRAYELDPFINLEQFQNGVTEDNLEEFILSGGEIGIFIDAMDSLPLKVKSRFICRANGIPVLMATSNGDTNMLDVERYDLDSGTNIFNGRLGNVEEDDFKYMNYSQWLELAVKIVGFDSLTPRMKQSISQIGKTLPSVPQLATTVNMGAASISYALRRISNKEKLLSGRYILSLESSIF